MTENGQINYNPVPIEVHSDARVYKRFERQNGVLLRFRGKEAGGTLTNLSATGLLAAFDIRETLPSISEKVDLHIELSESGNAIDLAGTVVRVQLVQGFGFKNQIHMAVSFSDITPASKAAIKRLMNFLLSGSNRYNI